MRLSVFLATSIKISGIMTYTTEDTGDQLHALRIRADLEQSELAALTSNSVGTPKPMLWERRAPARQKTMIMCSNSRFDLYPLNSLVCKI